VNKLEITTDKQLLAAAGNPQIRLFEVNSNNPQAVLSFDSHSNNVTAVRAAHTRRAPPRAAVRRRRPPGPAAPVRPHGRGVTGRRPAGAQVGFQKDSKWMYSGSEDGTVRIWDLRAPGCQREYQSRAAVNTVALHPNQGELISGARGPAGTAVCVPAGADGAGRERGHAGARRCDLGWPMMKLHAFSVAARPRAPGGRCRAARAGAGRLRPARRRRAQATSTATSASGT